jgi:hypothetical protein
MISLILLPFLMSLFVFIDFNLNFWVVLVIKIIYVLICIFILLLVNRKQFGDSIAHQIDNLKEYWHGIKGDNKNSK